MKLIIQKNFKKKNWISQIWESDNGQLKANHMTEKIGNQVIKYSQSYDDKLKDENGNAILYHIEYYDYDKKIAYTLSYDEATKMYDYWNNIHNFKTEEDWQSMFKTRQLVKDITFTHISSNFKNIFLSSINPMCYVSLKNKIIYNNYAINQLKNRILLNGDWLVQGYDMRTEFDGGLGISYSYDYLQDHFEDSIQDPAIAYKDKISNYQEIEHIK